MVDALPAVAARALAVGDADRRAMIERHLQRVHGHTLSPEELRRAVRGSFASYARYWVESFRLPGISTAQLDDEMTCDGWEHLDDALAKGKGAILALPHLGGWDFAGAWMGAVQGCPITVVVEPVNPPALFEWFASFRRTLGMTVIPLGPGVTAAVQQALRDNQVVVLLCDRDIVGGGIEVEFFGERTTLPGGPVTLALRSGAALLPTAVYFEGPRGHRGDIRVLPLERNGRFREDVVRGTQALAGALEDLIRAAPDQWHLFQPNWPSDPGYKH